MPLPPALLQSCYKNATTTNLLAPRLLSWQAKNSRVRSQTQEDADCRTVGALFASKHSELWINSGVSRPACPSMSDPPTLSGAVTRHDVDDGFPTVADSQEISSGENFFTRIRHIYLNRLDAVLVLGVGRSSTDVRRTRLSAPSALAYSVSVGNPS